MLLVDCGVLLTGQELGAWSLTNKHILVSYLGSIADTVCGKLNVTPLVMETSEKVLDTGTLSLGGCFMDLAPTAKQRQGQGSSTKRQGGWRLCRERF